MGMKANLIVRIIIKANSLNLGENSKAFEGELKNQMDFK
jgi:hypothetical protein